MRHGRKNTELQQICDHGEYIVREGEESHNMYVIQSGSVQITKSVGDDEVILATLGKGDFFGEMSLLESLPRDANAVAFGETHLLVIQPGGLLLRIRRDPTFAFEMLTRLSRRIRSLNSRMVKFIEERPESSDGVEEVLLFNQEHDLVSEKTE